MEVGRHGSAVLHHRCLVLYNMVRISIDEPPITSMAVVGPYMMNVVIEAINRLTAMNETMAKNVFIIDLFRQFVI